MIKIWWVCELRSRQNLWPSPHPHSLCTPYALTWKTGKMSWGRLLQNPISLGGTPAFDHSGCSFRMGWE